MGEWTGIAVEFVTLVVLAVLLGIWTIVAAVKAFGASRRAAKQLRESPPFP